MFATLKFRDFPKSRAENFMQVNVAKGYAGTKGIHVGVH